MSDDLDMKKQDHPEPSTGQQSGSADTTQAAPGFGQSFKSLRHKAIAITPAFIVNNSTNVLGAAHVATEMMMFKSGMGEDAKLITNPKNPINWLWQPLKTVFTETFLRSEIHGLGDLMKGNIFKNIYNRIVDMDAAVERFHQRPENIGKNARLLSPWQFRTTFAGLVVWTLSTFIPDRKETEQEIEQATIKQKTNPVGYVADRLKEAVWIPEWPKHKRQMIGLGYALIGVCSTIGAWRGRTKLPSGKEAYTFNRGYLFTSLISGASSLPLLFATDDQRGFGAFGTMMMGRIPFLFGSIRGKYNPGPNLAPDPGRHWYTLSSASFQVENLAQALIGGAEKRPDGTIIDHEAAHETGKKKAREITQVTKDESAAIFSDAPTTKIQNAHHDNRMAPDVPPRQNAVMA